MFTTRLKQEVQALREELSLFNQVRASLDDEMIALTLDPQVESTRSTPTSRKKCTIAASSFVAARCWS